MDTEKIIYSLNVEDVQNVALQELDRELNTEEIGKIEDKIAERINWYEAIADVLSEARNEQ